MRKRDFTLIELLVVIAIIGILVTLLLPSLGKARKVSLRAVCASNSKQINTAFHLFAKNNSNRLPPGGRTLTGFNRTDKVSWDDRIAEYMGRNLTVAEQNASILPHENPNVLMCPEDSKHLRGGSYLIRSYTVNAWRQWNEHGNSKAQALTQLDNNSFGVIGHIMSRTVDQIQSSSETLLMTEGYHGKAGLDWWSAVAREFDVDSIADFSLHYNDSRNYIMTDGHVVYKKNNYLTSNGDILDSE